MPFPVAATWIAETEAKLGVRFPAAFVTAKTDVNGGAVRMAVDSFTRFPFLDKSDRNRIQPTCGSIDREIITAESDCVGFPPNAVAIGGNGGGDLLVFLPLLDDPETLQHTVYWWDHETGDVHPAADDFGDLPKS